MNDHPDSFADCLVCHTKHYNACPALWGGIPERPARTDQADEVRDLRLRRTSS